jgi:hypothetical protein
MDLSIYTIQSVLLSSLILIYNLPMQAQPFQSVVVQKPGTNSNQKVNTPLKFAAPILQNRGFGAPGRQRGGPGGGWRPGSGGCPAALSDNTPLLTALVPIDASGIVGGLTTSERPTFWFYVPYPSPTYGIFVLEDETEQQTEYKVPFTETPGVVSFTLPATAAPLAVGKPYHWYFEVFCEDSSQNKRWAISYVRGNIQRLPSDTAPQRQSETVNSVEQVATYAAQGFWQDALTTAAELKRKNSTDTSWEILLQSVGLEDVAQQPLLNCCQP